MQYRDAGDDEDDDANDDDDDAYTNATIHQHTNAQKISVTSQYKHRVVIYHLPTSQHSVHLYTSGWQHCANRRPRGVCVCVCVCVRACTNAVQRNINI